MSRKQTFARVSHAPPGHAGQESGQSTVLITLALFVLMGMLALAIDGGNAYSQRRQMQVAADAAAIAGARELALGGAPAQIGTAVQYFAQQNRAESWEWQYNDGNNSVVVTTTRTFPTTLAQLAGISAMTASAVAEAQYGGISRANGLMPIAVEEFEFEVGEQYPLWINNLQAPGAFGWVNWEGQGDAGTLRDNICDPHRSGDWEIGELVPTTPGVKFTAAVRDCVIQWIDKPVTVIVYDEVTEQGSNVTYRIHSFAQFIVTSYEHVEGNGEEEEQLKLEGEFVKWVRPGEGGGPDRGLSSVQITR